MGVRISSDYFSFQTDRIKIKYMKEMILKSYKRLPSIYFGDNEFSDTYINNDTIFIPIDQWVEFYSKLLRLMDGDKQLVSGFSSRMKKYLDSFNKCTDQFTKDYNVNNKISKRMLKELFNLYSDVQAYAFINISLPIKGINQKLKCNNYLGYNIDNFMISLVEPHRTQKRRRELELAKKYIEGNLTEKEVRDYRSKEYIYSYESEWNFYDKKMDTLAIIEQKIKKLAKSLSVDNISKELSKLESSRIEKLHNLHNILINEYTSMQNNIYENNYFLMIFLINISTQEEYRHIVNTKFMYLIGKIARYQDIDISRTPTTKLIKYLSL